VRDVPVYDPGELPFLATIEANWQLIDVEFDQTLLDRRKLPPFHRISRGSNDFCRHEVWNNTDQERVVLISHFDRPMRLVGRFDQPVPDVGQQAHRYHKEAARNLKDWDDQLASAVMTADTLIEEAVKA